MEQDSSSAGEARWHSPDLCSPGHRVNRHGDVMPHLCVRAEDGASPSVSAGLRSRSRSSVAAGSPAVASTRWADVLPLVSSSSDPDQCRTLELGHKPTRGQVTLLSPPSLPHTAGLIQPGSRQERPLSRFRLCYCHTAAGKTEHQPSNDRNTIHGKTESAATANRKHTHTRARTHAHTYCTWWENNYRINTSFSI